MNHFPPNLASERGSVLVELLVAIPATLAVFGAIAAMSGVFGHSQQVTQERSQSIEEQQVGAGRMTREIREATNATIAPGGRELRIKTGRVDGEVVFRCSSDSCTRSVSKNGAETTPVVFIEGIDPEGPVFTGRPPDDPTFVEISLRVGDHDVSIDDGVAVTNDPAAR